MGKKIAILVVCLCFFQCVDGMRKVSSFASISVSKNIENLLFKSCDLRCLQKFQNMEINQGDGDLYINVFNVGQGNFVILRKENRVVIIDAGGEKRFDVEEKIDELLKDAVVDAVFVTHPHDDHFSLLNDLLEHFSRSFFDSTFYLSGKEGDWKTRSAQAFLKRLRTLSPIISDVEFLDNKQLEVSLLSGVVFKTFYLKPAVKREPNKLSLLLQVSYLGKNVLFTGDAEGDSIARLFQTVGDLSSVTSLVSSRDRITEIVKLFSTYTEAHKEFIKLKSLCCSLAETLANRILGDRFISDVQDLVNKLQIMKIVDKTFFGERNADILQEWKSEVSLFSGLPVDPFIYFYDYHSASEEARTLILENLCNNLNAGGLTNEAETLLKEKNLLRVPLFSIRQQYEQLRKMYIQAIIGSFDEAKSFNKLFKKLQALDLLEQDSPLAKFVYEQLQYFSEAYTDLLNEDLVELSSENFRAFSQNYFVCFREVNDILSNSISFNVPFDNTTSGVAHSKMKEWIFLNAKRSEFKNSHIVLLPHHGTNTENSQSILGLFAGRDFRRSEEQRTFIVSSSPFGPKKLPKASTLEMSPFFPVHPVHKFIYCRDYSDLINMVDTEKPIYLTGSSPAGVVTVKIDQNGNAFVLDLMRRGDGCLGWINTLTGSRVAF